MGYINNINCNDLLLKDNFNSLPDIDDPITLDAKGNILSRFKDNVWDFTSLSTSMGGMRKIYFDLKGRQKNPTLADQIIFESKLICYGFLYFDFGARSVQSVNTYFGNIRHLPFLRQECFNLGISISDFSKSDKYFTKLIDSLTESNKTYVNKIIKFYQMIAIVSNTYSNFRFSLSLDQFKELSKLQRISSDGRVDQTLVIPPYIYSKFLVQTDIFLKDFLFNSPKVESWFNDVFVIPNYACDYISILPKKHKLNLMKYRYRSTIQDHNLTEFAEKYKLSDKQVFLNFLSKLQYISHMKILSLTGMRSGEGLTLPFNCYEEIQLDSGKIIYIINGYTSKLTNVGYEKACWITSEGVKVAVQVAQFIGKLLAFKNGIELKASVYPLFPSAQKIENNSFYSVGIITQSKGSKISGILGGFELDNVDFNQLNKSNPFINYQEHGISPGVNWHFKSHQFRRTLAVYAARSGLVNIPALKSQLKHVCQDMTTYYTNYSNLVDNFIFDKTLIEEFKNEKIIDQVLTFEEDVTAATQPLFGAEGVRIQNELDKGNTPEFMVDRKKTEKYIRDGRLSYKRTPLGGCSKIGSCDKSVLIAVTACINCSNAIFSDRTIDALQIVKAGINSKINLYPVDSPHSIQLRNELSEIDRMLSKKLKVKDIVDD